ncbi:MAG: dynamin family protein, partial [Thiohalophilus sp.]
KEGLTILDTPGLNAIGNEPELTLNMLPSAQAVVFVLAADTGVTKSDMEMWNHHVKPLGGDARHGRIIVLNKVDTLWDELKADDEVNTSVANQCKSAAKMLGIEASNVFPVSAQKGLLAKIRTDVELLNKSNILALESILAKDILPRKQHLVRESIVGEIGGMAQQSRDLIASRLSDTNKQLTELKSLSGKNEDVIMHLMKKTREEQSTYHKSVDSFQANRKSFNEKHKELLQTLSLTQLDKLMSKTRKEMSGSKFTMTLKGSMKEFFEIIKETMDKAGKQTDQINMLLQTIYRQFNKEHEMADVKPRLITMSKYKRELDRLYHEAEAYRNSAKLTVTEQAFVVKKFFISMVSHARNILFEAHQDVEAWGKNAMAPLVIRIKEHKNQMEKRLESLRKINESRDTLQNRIQELEKAAETLNAQLIDINQLLETLNRPLESFIEQDAAQVA